MIQFPNIYTHLHDKKIDKVRSLKQHFPLEFNRQGSGWLPAAVQAAVKQIKSFLTHIHTKDVQVPSKITSLAIIYHP
jgi:hypothetical protein